MEQGMDTRLLFPEEFISSLLESGLREDGRSHDQIRTTTINVGSIATADGSSVVRCGGNCVTCGIKAELANPSETNPNEGYIVISLDTVSGYKGLSILTLTQTITDILMSSGFINMSALCIAKEQLCWVLYIDVMCTSIDGVVLDCSLMAIVAALRNVRLPNVSLSDGKPVVSFDNTGPLTLTETPPTSITFGLGNKWPPLVDPDSEEYKYGCGLLIISFISKDKMAGFFKFGGVSLSDDEIDICIKKAKKLCKTQRELIQSLKP